MADLSFENAVRGRRSIRGFLPQSIPQSSLERIFALAQQAPSNCNTQPWKVAIVSGERCHQLGEKISKAMTAGDIVMDFPYDGLYEGDYKARQHAAAAELYNAMGIGRENKVARHDAFMRNFRFFDAPHAAFFFLDHSFGIREAADLGMFAQTLMLALTAEGMGSCPQTALSFQAHIVRSELRIDDRFKLLFGMSFGYPDEQHPANHCRTARAELSNAVEFYN
ncbi:nitroreductase [Zhongshania sp.]|uniref:nitroreductase n=1 Tax=Zhongshania sp. TaxID=1971902 RepID=UPI003561C1C1